MLNREAQKTNTGVTKPRGLDWNNNPSVQIPLEVIVNIVTEEYVKVVWQNAGLFSDEEMHGL